MGGVCEVVEGGFCGCGGGDGIFFLFLSFVEDCEGAGDMRGEDS